MKGLILKDFYSWQNHLKTYGMLFVMFVIFGIVMKMPTYSGIMAVVVTMTMTLSGFTTDEYYHWDTYAGALPIKKRTVVGAKYLTSLLLMLCVGVISGITSVFSALALKMPVLEVLASIGGICAVVPVIIGVVTPFIYKLGTEKARIVFIAIVLLPVILSFLGSKMIKLPAAGNIIKKISEISPLVLCSGIVVFIAAFYTCSYLLSVRFYENKEF